MCSYFEKNGIFRQLIQNLFMKNCFLLWLLLVVGSLFAQEASTFEKPPVFPGCETQPIEALKTCFNTRINTYIFNSFLVPQKVVDDSYQGEIKVLFEVDKLGVVSLIYVDAVYDELKKETQRIFEALPTVIPGTYNGRPTFYQYALGIQIPLVDPLKIEIQQTKFQTIERYGAVNLNTDISQEYQNVTDSIIPYRKLEYKSQLNIPFTHNYYSRFDQEMNGLGTNSHTAAKPFIYAEVAPYYDFI